MEENKVEPNDTIIRLIGTPQTGPVVVENPILHILYAAPQILAMYAMYFPEPFAPKPAAQPSMEG